MTITLNRPSVYQVGSIRLIAGANDVAESKELDKFLANKIVKKDIDRGVLVVEKPKPKRTPKKEVEEKAEEAE